MSDSVNVSFELESLQIVNGFNDGNGNFADRDIMSFTVMDNAQVSTLLSATELNHSLLPGNAPGGLEGGNAVPLDSFNRLMSQSFTMQEGDMLSVISLVGCDNSSGDAIARHNQSLSRVLDIYSASFAAAGGIVGSFGPVGLVVGILCVAIAAILQLAKDCIGSGPAPKSGVVFAQTIDYTYDSIQAHAIEALDENRAKEPYWKESVPYTSSDGVQRSILTYRVYRVQPPVQFPSGGSGPGMITPHIGGSPNNWITASGRWVDEKSLISVTVTAGPNSGSAAIAPLQKVALYLGSPEAQYRAGTALGTFDSKAPRPARQISIESFAPSAVEMLCAVASEIAAQEGSKPNAADRYSGSIKAPWTVPMIATAYGAALYPPSPSNVTATQARTQAVAASQDSTKVAATPPTIAMKSSPTVISGVVPTENLRVAPSAVQYADTVAIPGNAFLQLYAIHDKANPKTIWGYCLRYLRYDNGNVVSDVMLNPYMPQPN